MRIAPELPEDIKNALRRINDNCVLLYNGWQDRVEYEQPVKYHEKSCLSRVRVVDNCECPIKNEKRARQVKRSGLLDQLQQYQQNKDVNRNPKAARGAPKVKTPKTLPELNGFFTLDEISCEVYSLLDRVFEEAERDRVWLSQPVKTILSGLPYQVTQFAATRPDLVHDIDRATDRWVATARRALHMTVSDAMFEGTLCENCGGALAVAWDNSTEVRCVGTPSAPPCGHTYPRSEWVELYERRKRE